MRAIVANALRRIAERLSPRVVNVTVIGTLSDESRRDLMRQLREEFAEGDD